MPGPKSDTQRAIEDLELQAINKFRDVEALHQAGLREVEALRLACEALRAQVAAKLPRRVKSEPAA